MARISSCAKFLATCLRWHVRSTCPVAAALEQNDVVPDVINVTVAFAIADLAKTAFSVQREASVIPRKNLRL